MSVPKRFSSIICQTNPAKVSIYSDSIYKNLDIGVLDSTDIVDLSATLITSNVYRRGFNSNATIVVKNNATKTISNAIVWVKFNKKLKYQSSSGYLLKTDTTIKFSVPTLKRDEETTFKIVFYADPSTCNLKDYLNTMVWLDTTGLSKDRNKNNNHDNKWILIVASYDPNIKQEHNTNGYAWREGNKLRYFVQFQNTGTDTAINITVIDTLSPALLARTLVFNGASHVYDYILADNVLKVSFPNIYLPDSSVNKANSIGHFDFSIDIDPRLNQEQKFYNQANIYFDFNTAVKTNKKYVVYTSLVKTGQTNQTTYCGNDTIKVGYSSNFNFNSGNKFKLILSNPKGLFDSGTKTLDSLSSTNSTGNFKTLIPTGTVENSLYRLKVVSTNPAGSILEDGLSNSFTIVNSLTKPTFSFIDSVQCGKDSIQLTINTSYSDFKLYDRKTLILSNGKLKPKIKLPIGKHFYTAEANYKNCRISSDTLKIFNDSFPVIKLSSPSHPNLKVCSNDSVTLNVNGCATFDLFGNSFTYLSSHKSNQIKVVIPSSSDTRTVIGTSNFGCKDTSNTLKFTVNSKPNVTLSISDPDYEICQGTSVVFTGKGATTYQLLKNDTAWLSSFTSAISSASFKTTDKIILVGTDNNGCSNSSSPISITVNPLPDVKLSCSDPDLILCKNSTTSLSFNGAGTYRLFKNNVIWLVPTSNPYSTSSIINNDELFVEGTTTRGCIGNSNKLKFKVVNPVTGLSITNKGDICITDTLFLSFSGGKSYDLFKNNTLLKTIKNQSFASQGYSNNDVLFAEGTDSFGCISKSTSLTLKLVTKPTIILTNPDSDNTLCKNENVTINLSGGTKYDLYRNTVLWKPNSGATYSFADANNNDEIYAIGYTNSGCNSNSNKIKLTVWPLPAKPTITKSGTVLSSSYTTGNQWYEGTTKLTGANSQNYSPVKKAIYYVDHTDVHGCVSPLSDGFNYLSISKVKLPGLKIYPNPASDYLIIETGESGKYQISLIDITGKLIKEETFIGNHFEWQLKPAKGLYHLKIVNEKGESENVAVEFK